MRDIKFRAWDVRENQMIFDGIEYELKVLASPMGGRDPIIGFNDDPEYFRLMQYTGLKDKEGKEIYESDIVKLVNADGDTIYVVCEYGIVRRDVIGGNGPVEVDIPCFYFKSNGHKTFPIVNNYAGKHDLELFEVVGNIHQHPNLLNQTV
jgi:uncharacterized phage protein (TIGR01671 family)